MGRLHRARLSTLINLCHPVSWEVFIRHDSLHWSTSVTRCHGTSSSGMTLYTDQPLSPGVMGRLHQARLSTLINLCHPVSWDVFIGHDSFHRSLSKSQLRERSGVTEAKTVLVPFKVKTISFMRWIILFKRSVFLALHLDQSFKFQFSVLGSKSRDKPRDMWCEMCISVSVADPGFPRGKQICQFFAENCMRTKEFGPKLGWGVCIPGALLDPPLLLIFYLDFMDGHVNTVSRNAQCKDVYERAIEIPQRTGILRQISV